MDKASSLLTKLPGLFVGAGVDDVGWWGRLRRPPSPPHTNRANGNDGRRKRPHSTSTQPPPLQNGNSYARGRAGDRKGPHDFATRRVAIGEGCGKGKEGDRKRLSALIHPGGGKKGDRKSFTPARRIVGKK